MIFLVILRHETLMNKQKRGFLHNDLQVKGAAEHKGSNSPLELITILLTLLNVTNNFARSFP